MPEIYISTDVETDGPIPGPHSMLSLASAAYTADERLVSTFSANLETLPDASAHPKTAEWWATQPEAWAACRSNLQDPAAAMRRYVDWVGLQPGKPVAAPRRCGRIYSLNWATAATSRPAWPCRLSAAAALSSTRAAFCCVT